MVHGELEIGTEAKPHTRKATITLTDNVKDEDMTGIGGTNDRSDRGIMMMGGTLNLHGNRDELLDQAGQDGRRGQQLDRSPECR